MKTLLQVAILTMVIIVANAQTQETSILIENDTNESSHINGQSFEKVENLTLFSDDKKNEKNDCYWVMDDYNNLTWERGNVGIGVREPRATLHVNGDIRFDYLSGSGQRMVVADPSGVLSTQQTLWRTGNNGIIYYNGGKVGIGTSNPEADFHVNGHIKSTNFRTINYSTIIGEEANSGHRSIVIGNKAGAGELLSNDQVAIGHQAGQNNTGDFQIAMGGSAGYNNSGDRTLSLGFGANKDNTGNDVIAIGFRAGEGNTQDNQFIVQQQFTQQSRAPLIQGNFTSGMVGIGTSSPQQKLHVAGTTRIDGNVELRNGHRFMGTITNHSLYLRTNNTNQLTILGNGNVGIGIAPSSNVKLTVNGKILATEVEVVSQIQSDFVFEPDYELMSLYEIESFVKENKHLPEIPSMHEFAEQGQNLAKVQDLMLRKIEELTLHIINQQKEIDELKELLMAKEE